MEPLAEMSLAEGGANNLAGYIYKVDGGMCYSVQHESTSDSLKIAEIIFQQSGICVRVGEPKFIDVAWG